MSFDTLPVVLFICLLNGVAYATTLPDNAGDHWYFGGLIGAGISENGNTHIPSIASKPPLTSEPRYRNAYTFNLSSGYKFENSVRIEAEIGYQQLSMSHINNAIGAGTVTYVRDSNTNLASVFVNGIYDIELDRPWLPFIGLGLGYVNVENKIIPNPKIPVAPGIFFTDKHINYHTLGYQANLGVSYQLSDNLFLNLYYRYMSTFKTKVTGRTNLGLDNYQTKQIVSTNTVGLGVNYFYTH